MAGLVALAIAGGAALAAGGPSLAAIPAAGRPVVVIGIAGLRWSDLSPSATPAIWRLARAGSAGSLVTTTLHTTTCPADAWLTLNSGARSAEPPAGSVRCPAVRVLPRPGHQALVPGMRSLIAYNSKSGYDPRWGTLATSPGSGRCATAIGPGAGLALADRAGRVARYLPALPSASRQAAAGLALAACPLTMLDLGSLPVSPARAARLSADDALVARVAAAAPAGSIITVAGLGDDDSPHLRTIAVAGAGYRSGLLTSESTRQPGVVTITDLTPSIFGWLGQPAPAGLTGSAITSAGRGPLAAAVEKMIGQDAANQVYRSIVGWFFLYYGVAEAVVLLLIGLVLRGSGEQTVRRRVAWYTGAAVFTAAVPAGTFLAGLVPWGQLSHPAVWLYGLGFAWAAVIAAGALAGPWRSQPFGPPGFVAAVTLAVIGVDVIAGSRLQVGAPFGLSLVEAGRFYGVGNNALGVYAVAGMLTAGWAAASAGAAGRRAALTAAGAVALASVIASGWPGFGAKVGGTIAMVPAYLVLLAAVAGVRITLRRGLVIAVSGIALVAIFAVLDYLIPAIGPSHLGGFVGQVVHGERRRHFAAQDQLEPALADRDLVHAGGAGGGRGDRPDARVARPDAAPHLRDRQPGSSPCSARSCSPSGWPSCSAGWPTTRASAWRRRPCPWPCLLLSHWSCAWPARPSAGESRTGGLICAQQGNSLEDWVEIPAI